MIQDVVRELGYLALGTRLRRLGERLQAETQRVLEHRGVEIPAAQVPFLAALDRLGPSPIGELADAIGVSQPAATRTIGLLTEAGLVASVVDRDDLRCRRVGLSARGRAFVQAGKAVVWPEIEAAVRDVCAGHAGSFLEQLAAIEDGLAEVPLLRRVAARAAVTGARRAPRPRTRRTARRTGAHA